MVKSRGLGDSAIMLWFQCSFSFRFPFLDSACTTTNQLHHPAASVKLKCDTLQREGHMKLPGWKVFFSVAGPLGDKLTGRQPTRRQLLDHWATPVGSSGRQDIETSWMQHTYSVAPRNNRIERLFITWTNINGFIQFFHGRSHNWIYHDATFITAVREYALAKGN